MQSSFFLWNYMYSFPFTWGAFLKARTQLRVTETRRDVCVCDSYAISKYYTTIWVWGKRLRVLLVKGFLVTIVNHNIEEVGVTTWRLRSRNPFFLLDRCLFYSRRFTDNSFINNLLSGFLLWLLSWCQRATQTSICLIDRHVCWLWDVFVFVAEQVVLSASQSLCHGGLRAERLCWDSCAHQALNPPPVLQGGSYRDHRDESEVI